MGWCPGLGAEFEAENLALKQATWLFRDIPRRQIVKLLCDFTALCFCLLGSNIHKLAAVRYPSYYFRLVLQTRRALNPLPRLN